MRRSLSFILICLAGCHCSAEGIRITAKTIEGQCGCETPGRLDLIGSVLEVREKSFVLDECLPTQDCSAPRRADFSITAAGFSGFTQYLRPSGFVRVQLETVVEQKRCNQRMVVSGVESWVGATNPAHRPNEFYFGAGNNFTELFEGSAVGSRRCAAGDGTLAIETQKSKVTAHAGKVARWRTSNNGSWEVHLLSAGACGSPAGWSFWVGGPPVS